MARGPGKTQRLYTAEDKAPILACERPRSIASVRKWVESIRVSAWCKRRFGALEPITVTLDNSVEYSYGDECGIRILSGHKDRRAVVLHELAHVITSRLWRRAAPHGVVWLRVYKALIRRFIGDEGLKQFERELGGRQPKKLRKHGGI